MSGKTCGECAETSVSNAVTTGAVYTEWRFANEKYVKMDGAALPLTIKPETKLMAKHECPLCGGALVPMGWFRAGGLHELLHKCESCGLAVFR